MKPVTYLSPKTEVKQSAIQGKGLFAKEKILRDEIVAIKGGSIFIKEEWQKLEKDLGPAEIQIGDNFFIAPTSTEERDGSMIYTNHSCDPNIGIQGQIVFVAMRNIEAGEELTHDWATTDNLDDFEMNCNCGAKDCRGKITGKDWMNIQLQEKYKGYFSWYLQKKIDNQHPDGKNMSESLNNRLKSLSEKFKEGDELKSKLIYKKGVVSIEGTDLHFTSDEILKLIAESKKNALSNKVAQSDVPDTMLSLLSALKAVK